MKQKYKEFKLYLVLSVIFLANFKFIQNGPLSNSKSNEKYIKSIRMNKAVSDKVT